MVVSKNAGGTKRVTSLADALKLNFGIVTTDKRRGTAMSASMVMNGEVPVQSMLDGDGQNANTSGAESEQPSAGPVKDRASRIVADSHGSPRRVNGLPVRVHLHPRSSHVTMPPTTTSHPPAGGELDDTETDETDFNDTRAHDVTHGRLVHGHIVPDDFPSPATSAADASVPEEDPMTMSHASSFFQPSDPHALGGSGEDHNNSEDDEEIIANSKVEHMITLVGDVKNRTVLIVDDMIDKPGSWIAAAETVVKRGLAKKVYCIATHGIFGGDCLEQMQACDCIDTIVVTNSYPVPESKQQASSKLVLLDLSFLLGEAIRRNHYGESISPLFQHIVD